MVDSTTSVINASSARQSILFFADTNAYVDLGSNIDLANQSFTIEFWDRRMVWGQRNLLGQGKDLYIGYNAECHLTFQTHGSTLTAPKAYDNDYAWHHWAVTFDHDTKTRIIYLNGFPLIDDAAKSPYTGTGALSLGPNSPTTTRNAGGDMADVRIWNYVRSQDEIQQARFRRLNGDESGLLGYWPLDEGQGETAHDRTSHGNHGKITVPHWRQQLALQSTDPITKLQSIFTMHGHSSSRVSYVRIPSFSTGAFPHTVEAWFCPYGSYARYSWLLCIGQLGNWSSHYWTLNQKDKTIEVGARNSAQDRLEIPIQEDRWHHIASVFDGKQLSVYVDGTLYPHPIPTSISLNSYYLYLGQNYSSYNTTNEDGRGKLTELRLWKRARSQEEIQADLYHRLMGDEKDLVIYWPLNEGYKNKLHDKTSNARHTTFNSSSYHWEEQLFLLPAHHDSLKTAQQQASANHRQQVGSSGTTTASGLAGTTFGGAGTATAPAQPARPSVPSLNGTDAYIDCGSGIEPTEAITVEAWVKHQDGNGYIVNRGGIEAEDGFSLSWEDGNIRVELQNTQSKKKVSCENAAPSDNEWHHVAFTWSRKEKVITTYIDGKPAQTTKQFTGTLGIPTQALNIGRNALHGGYFHGQITEVRIWEQARSQAEIEQTMKQRLEGNEIGLIGYWPLDDKQATAKDRSGNHHNGTLQGATWEETELPVTAHRLWATGLEDYGYWYRWKQSLPQQASSNKSFRRGRIWA